MAMWMSRADRRAWKDAGHLGDLGRLMAAWLTGKIESRPGYQPGCGPDPETAELIPTLAAACRAGFVTVQSQPGELAQDRKGRPWHQRAAVQGFIDDEHFLLALTGRARQAGLRVFVHGPRHATGSADGITVSRWDGEDYTTFGAEILPRDLPLIWGGITISRTAYRGVEKAWQLTIVDPEWGRNDRLWALLDRSTERRR